MDGGPNHELFQTLFLVQLAGYALLIPFFGWGIYLLRRRYLYFEESTTTLELTTSVFVGVFFWFETFVLRQALSDQLLPYLAAILGLSMATFALYAHVAISLISRLLVDMVTPGDDTALDQPRYGPVEALERIGDYEAALGEYLVLARIYSRNVEVLSRVGRVQLILGNTEEAAAWYLRARKRAKSPNEALAAVNQLCQLYDHELDTPEKADCQLAQFMRDFPDSLDIEVVRERLNRRANKSDWSVSDFLGALEEEPLSAAEETSTLDSLPAVGPPLKANRPPPGLVALETAGAAEKTPEEETTFQEPQQPDDKEKSTAAMLTPLSESVFNSTPKKTKPPRNEVARKPAPKNKSTRRVSQLESLQKVDSTKKSKKETPAPKPSEISLDPMEDNPA